MRDRAKDRRVVDQNVHRAEGRFRFCHCLCQVFISPDIARNCHCLGADIARNLPNGISAARHQRDIRAFGSKQPCCGLADPPTGPRNHHGFAINCHFCPLFALLRDMLVTVKIAFHRTLGGS